MPKRRERSKLLSEEGLLKPQPGVGALAEIQEIFPSPATEFIIKAADEVVTNTAAHQNDDELFFPVKAEEVWDVELVLKYTATTAADFAFLLDIPGTGGTAEGVVHRLGTGAASGADDSLAWGDFTASTSSGALAAGAAVGLHLRAIVTAGDTEGFVFLKWAQATAAASDATLKAGSYLSARKIS